MNEAILMEIEQLRKELLETTPVLIELLKKELEESDKKLAKMKIRGKYLYLVPDFILSVFYSEFKEKDE